MTAGEIALLVVAVVGAAAVVGLSIALVSVARAVRSLQSTVELVRQDAAARTWSPAGVGVPTADADGRAAVVRRRDPGSLIARVAVANPYLDVSDPVIKVLALASGTSRAASRLRRARQDG